MANYAIPYIYLNNGLVVEHVSSPHNLSLFLYRWGTLEQLSPPGVETNEFEWSPDGEKIALTYFNDRNELYLGILDVGTHQLLPSLWIGESQFLHPAWSPDGKMILFKMLTPENHPGIYLLDIRTNMVTPTSLMSDDTLNQKEITMWGIAWSPGPSALVSICFHEQGDTIRCKIYATDDDFTNLTYIVDGTSPQWLSDKKTIVYTCENVEGICSYSFQSKQERIITTEITYPVAWSPDGLLAFDIQGGGEGDKPKLFVYNTFFHTTFQISPALYEKVGGGFVFP